MQLRLTAAKQCAQGIAMLCAAIVPLALLVRVSSPQPDVVLGPARTYEAASAPPPAVARQAPLSAGPIPYFQARAPSVVRVVEPLAAEQPTPTVLELQLLTLLNDDRASLGRPSVEYDPVLLPIARQRASQQSSLLALSHVDAVGRIAFAGLLGEAQVPYRLAGENLARLSESPDLAVRAEYALMLSPTHRRNILEPAFDLAAVGVDSSTTGRTSIAQLFRATP